MSRALDYGHFMDLSTDADRWSYADACDWSKLESSSSGSSSPAMTGLGRLIWHCAVHGPPPSSSDDNEDKDKDKDKDDAPAPASWMLQRAHQAHNRRSTAISEPDEFGQRPVDLALFYQDTAAVRALRRDGARLDMHPLLRTDTDWCRRRPALLARAVVTTK